MTRLTTDVNPREGRVTPERWIAFLEGFSHVTKALAREFPELAVSVPVVTLQQRIRVTEWEGEDA